jgi:hypothetical protein
MTDQNEWIPCIKRPVIVHVRKQRPGETHVSTREGITPLKPDDLIMRGVQGEEYRLGWKFGQRPMMNGPTQSVRGVRRNEILL